MLHIQQRGRKRFKCGVRSEEQEGKRGRTQRGTISMYHLILIVIIVSASFAMPAFANGSPDEVIQAVEKHYSGLMDMTARVKQKNYLKSLDKTQTFSGALAIRKPGRLRLDYTNGQRIVIDGNEAWFYSEKSKQVIKRAFADFEQANIPVAFLLGAASIRDDFEVSQPDKKNPRLLDLKPKRAGAAMTRVRISVDNGGRITELVIFDRSGNTSTVAFSDIAEDAGVDEEQFRFSVPRGTEIIEQ